MPMPTVVFFVTVLSLFFLRLVYLMDYILLTILYCLHTRTLGYLKGSLHSYQAFSLIFHLFGLVVYGTFSEETVSRREYRDSEQTLRLQVEN